jgi:hypothetical protein
MYSPAAVIRADFGGPCRTSESLWSCRGVALLAAAETPALVMERK